MNNNPISDLFEISMAKLKEMIDVNTIVGNKVSVNENVTLIPVSKVKFSFVSGGTEMTKGKARDEDKYPFGGATGGCVTLDPIAFVAVTKDDVKVLHFNDKTYLGEALIEKIPSVLEKVKDMFGNKKMPKVTNLEVIEKK